MYSSVNAEGGDTPQTQFVQKHKFYAFIPIMKSKYLSRDSKGKINKIITQPVMLYTSETWYMLKKNEKKIAEPEKNFWP